MRSVVLILAVLFALPTDVGPHSQRAQAPAPAEVRVRDETVESSALGKTMKYRVLLPSGYGATLRRYPVLYLLHGLAGDYTDWTTRTNLADYTRPLGLIVVMPDGGNQWYTNADDGSARYEDWLAADLPADVVKKFRTINSRYGRSIAGLSMGGYGALRIGMKRPDVYAAMWAMAPCCLNQGSPNAERAAQLEAVKTPEQARNGDRGVLVGFASAAAWSPNPDNPPLFLDLPTKNGAVVPEVIARYGANSPLAMVSQYAPNLRKYKAMVVDVGKDDTLLASIRQFDARLKQLHVPHEFSVRDGDHGSHVVSQFETKILPFFSQHLSFEQPAR